MNSLSFNSGNWLWVAIAGLILLIPLGILAWRRRSSPTSYLALAFRCIGIALLLICLLDPHWTSERASQGANILTILADNSESLQLTDPGESSSRAETMREQLAGLDSSWIDTLSEDYQIRSYAFDRNVRRVSDFAQLDFQGDRSSLGKSLLQLKERFNRQPLQGIVLFTDGNATDLDESLPDLSGLPPIYPIVVGSKNTHPDIILSHIDLRQTAFDDAPISLTAEVTAQNVNTSDIEVSIEKLQIPGERSLLDQKNATPPSKTIRSPRNGTSSRTTFSWKPTGSGVQFYNVSATSGALENKNSNLEETTLKNNHRIVMVNQGKAEFRILYVTGRPNWEYKFLNRSLSEDPQLQMVGLIRVAKREPVFDFKGRSGESSNPLYRGFGEQAVEEIERYDQPVMIRVNTKDKDELRGGFPQTAEELFSYDAVIIDDLEADFFSFNQLSLLRRFASERGGGLLLLGGADSLENGGYATSPLASALPVYLDRIGSNQPADDLSWKLTREGWVEPWVRIRPLESEERSRLNAMPSFKVLNPLSAIKPGARVLANVEDSRGNSFPSLVAQNYGFGRVACVAVGDLWRWGLAGESEYADLARFWRQLARWLVSDTPQQVELQVTQSDSEDVSLVVHARDQEYRPLELGQARITIKRIAPLTEANDESENPSNAFAEVALYAEPVPDRAGQFAASFAVRDAGAYKAEVEVTDSEGLVIGTAETGWINDPSAKEFLSLVPNRSLLEEIARQTGGKLLRPSDLNTLSDELNKRPAPISETYSYPIWNNTWVFLIVLACLLAEWAIRRKRGLV